MRGATFKRCRRLALALALVGAGVPDDARAEVRPPHNYRHRMPGSQYCPPTYQPSAPAPTAAPPRTGADGRPQTEKQRDDTSTEQPQRMDGLFDQQQQQQQQQDQANQQASPSTNSTASASNSASPNMIGDFFGGAGGGTSSVAIFQFSSTFLNAGNPFNPVLTGPGDDVHFNTTVGATPTLESSVLILGLPGTGTANSINAAFAGGATTFALQENTVLTQFQQTNVADPLGFTAQFVSEEARLVANAASTDIETADFFDLFATYDFFDVVTINIPSPGTGVVGRVKVSENVSPIPRDRVFMNYSHFANVPFLPQGVDVNRFVPGFEKTLFGGIMSAEMRFPFASTLSPDIIADGATSDDEVVFGNMSAIFKTLIYQDCHLALAGGLQVAMPTADDVRVILANGTELVRVQNESVHLMPYVGALYTPNDRFFAQGFVQVDVDANGNPVVIGGNAAGDLNDATFMYVDGSIGYWLYRSSCCCDTLTGIAPIFEAHWNTTLEETNAVGAGLFRVGTPGQDIDIVNLVVGSVFEFNNSTTLTAAYCTPVSDDQDFDGEVRIIFNHRFGPQSRASRAQF